MKIFFSPEYSGNVYMGLGANKNICMDSVIVDTAGLVSMLELDVGIHYPEESHQQRVARYYKAMKTYMAEHPDNVLHDSFSLSGLGTAEVALRWRDELLMARWSPSDEAPSERIEALCGIEKHFDGAPSLAERIERLIKRLAADNGVSYIGYEIIMPCDKGLLHPIIQELIGTMIGKGATVSQIEDTVDDGSNLSKIRRLLKAGQNESITIDPADRSFLIYRFPNEVKANEYLAYRGDEEKADLWINSDNKTLDNWLTLMGKPAAGSEIRDSGPQVVQLFVLGIKLLYSPLNITTLIDWLYAPMHPLPASFRYAIANSIIKEGGYRNSASRSLIEKFISGGYDTPDEKDSEIDAKALERKQKRQCKERQEKVDVFMPSLESSEEKDIDAAKLRKLVANLGLWARQRIVYVDLSTQDLWAQQLGQLATMCDTLMMLIDSESSERIKPELLDTWLHSLYQPEQFTQYFPQKGCRTLIDSPMKMAAKASKTLWVNVDLPTERKLDCDFLYPSEYGKACEDLKMYDHEVENRYISRMETLPFKLTEKQLIITLCDYRKGEPSPKPPIIVRLEKLVTNIDEFIIHPNLNDELSQAEDVVKTINAKPCKEFHIDNANLIRWPDHISPTTIETLVLHPFDYVMKNIADIQADGPNQLAKVRAIKGNVAHAVIETLFSPRENDAFASPDEIKERILKEYDTAFEGTIDSHGAILRQSENLLEAKLLKEQLRTCIDNLVQILQNNHLHVTACERQAECNMGLLGSDDTNDMHARIDMTVVDSEGNEAVIDFKWTGSNNYYLNPLKENRSVQLALYRRILQEVTGKEVRRVAYFLMPKGRLFSNMPFVGKFCEQIDSESNADIVEQIVNSFRYRKEQIDDGTIEMCEGLLMDGLTYDTDTQSKNLFPLTAEPGSRIKAYKKYSEYNSFH